jgi:hypothetical protein
VGVIELTSRLDPIHRRVLARIRCFKAHCHGQAFTDHLLTDPEACPEEVLAAVVDLYDIGVFQRLAGDDFDAVIRAIAVGVARLETRRASNRTG